MVLFSHLLNIKRVSKVTKDVGSTSREILKNGNGRELKFYWLSEIRTLWNFNWNVYREGTPAQKSDPLLFGPYWRGTRCRGQEGRGQLDGNEKTSGEEQREGIGGCRDIRVSSVWAHVSSQISRGFICTKPNHQTLEKQEQEQNVL